ncbi:MAG: NADP-dependent phosphogluconate dehydrogenase [Phycisphaerales bacterium]|nr:NADP-dependent phosphogluconate dehydrogenase [Phycisphaerales bacterium]
MQSDKSLNCELGMVGLGVMGRNLLLNMADHGHAVAGYDKNQDAVAALQRESGELPVYAAGKLKDMIAVLRRPRTVMLLVPAGDIVDQVMKQLLPLLDAGDLIIDGGNSHFTDTDRRVDEMKQRGVQFIGMGVSGGADGARHGPSMMPGGSAEPYTNVQSLFEDVAAKVEGDPCVAFLGPRSAGHYVKMVHNGIEYGVMQLIAETYDIMRHGLGLGNDEMQDVFRHWNATGLGSFLIGITADILGTTDEITNKPLIDLIRGEAQQKGTGMWTSQDAMSLHTPTPTIDAAVIARDVSGLGGLRSNLNGGDSDAPEQFPDASKTWIPRLQQALQAATILTYAQGMSLLRTASHQYDYGLSLEAVSRIWRGGCIIRAAILDDMRSAFQSAPDLPSLMQSEHFAGELAKHQGALRTVVAQSVNARIPVMALSASLAYFDSMHCKRLPANLIQAQRDYFGSHTYERIDREGTFHTEWKKN